MDTNGWPGPAGPAAPAAPAAAPAAVLEALGDPTRRAIFELVAVGPRAVGELAGELPVSRPAVSQHLKVLKEAGLVVDQPAGTRRLYRVNPAGVGALRGWLDELDQLWSSALASFKEVAEQVTETKPEEKP